MIPEPIFIVEKAMIENSLCFLTICRDSTVKWFKSTDLSPTFSSLVKDFTDRIQDSIVLPTTKMARINDSFRIETIDEKDFDLSEFDLIGEVTIGGKVRELYRSPLNKDQPVKFFLRKP